MSMLDAKQILDRYFLEMRWRCLSLAADLDRVQRGQGSDSVMADSRLQKLREAVKVLLEPGAGRAERVLMVFSDTTPPPK